MPRRRRTNGARPAFTLIEVLATMVLLGIVLPVAMRGVSMALAAAEYSRHTAEASSLAQQKLSELVTLGPTSSTGNSGDFGADHPEFHWTLQTQSKDYGLTEFDVTIAWNERGQEKSLVVSTLVYQTATGVTP
jgi:type II secretion system protein I